MGCTKCIDSLSIDIYNAQEYEEQFQEFTNLRFLQPHITPHHQLIGKISPMIKNDENCFPIIIKDKSKIIFDISEIYPDEKNGTCLFFNKSIYIEGTECIDKPENTFYVVNDTLENTGAIKNCSEACKTCIGEN